MPLEIAIIEPGGATRHVPLEGNQLRMGRSSDNDLSFPSDMSLSRHHLVLLRAEDGWYVEDLGAKNRTTLNGRRLEGKTPLTPGDRIGAGQVVVVFGGTKTATGPVQFVAGTEDGPLHATVMTSLRGVLSRESTLPGAKKTGEPANYRGLPLDHPGVAALIRAGRELAGHRPLDELFELILDLSIQAVGAERGVLMTLEGDDLVIRAVRGDGFKISSVIRDRVINERASLLVRDTKLDEAWSVRESIVGQQIRSIMAVPLQTNDRVIGLVNVDSRSFVRPFTPDDLDLLTVLANVAAIRIEQQRLALVEQQERLITRDLEQAAEIQRRLLPRSAPSVPGFDIAGHNLPCRTVGGDYFDFFPYSDGRIGLVLGDVSGKGMPAALLMTALKGGVQVLLSEAPDDVAVLMSRLDRVVSANFPRNRFVSLFFGLLDPRTGEMTYCNAGHNPPFLVHSSGSTERLPSCGTILGIFPDMGYDIRTCRLEPGDVLALFSDGVTEEHNPAGEEFGEQRLESLLVTKGREGAVALVEGIRQAVLAWAAGAPAADDVTVVVARRVP
ncbi:MAG TPA: SpoIIE family protein phosphatase [Candidatus Polarisedimenticolaceae bacterium]|nr:SpoIIE family protein phosphatase [Candidatus Polarisedimenticolaceae bacterium]